MKNRNRQISRRKEKGSKKQYITSDGVINCYYSEEAFVKFIDNAFSAYGEDNIEDAKHELSDVLGILSQKGSGDDMAFSIIRKPLAAKKRQETNQ